MRAEQVVVALVACLLMCGGCKTQTASKHTIDNRTSRRTNPLASKAFDYDHIPETIESPLGKLRLLTIAENQRAIDDWVKSFPLPARTFKGTVQGNPEESFVVVAYISKSGFASWNVHLFRNDPNGRWRCLLFVSGLNFAKPGTRISSGMMPDTKTIVLKDERNNEVARFPL
ncbi:MAG: hypothetical protein JNJ45_07520 [Chthonomonas sp.]|nr:hypothetical protein [Chthonomonas sp.]